MNGLQVISGVSCFEKDGTAYLRLEDVARGLGFTTVATSGNEVIRWNTVHKYLHDLGVAGSCNGTRFRNACPTYIPENIFYRLAMKAKNETAEKFQALVAVQMAVLFGNFVGVGGVRHRPLQVPQIPEAVADAALQPVK